MSNNKQSSVELLAKLLLEKVEIKGDGYGINTIIALSKRLHKQETIDAHTAGYIIGGGNGDIHEPEQYYNETFGGNNDQQ